MSEEQLKAFLEKVKADTSLQEKLNGAADADAVVEIAKDAGFSITAEDIQSRYSIRSRELTDEELEGAAGGRRDHATYMTHVVVCHYNSILCCHTIQDC